MSQKYLRVCSDLHLEAFQGRNPDSLMVDFLPKDDRDADSILILAGDISSAPDQLAFFLRACLERYGDVIFVPGNHEYYKHNYDAWNKTMSDRLTTLGQEHAKNGSSLYFSTSGVESVVLGATRFIFGALWADGGPTLADKATVGHFLNDFRLITRDDPMGGYPRRFTVNDMISEHKKQKAEIERLLRTPFDGKTVVVTHHLPSRRLVSKRFWPSDGSDGANGGFASDCDNIICTLEPDLWVHGHTHDTIDTELWKTRIVCNPAGYRGEWVSPHNSFMTSEKREDGSKRAITVPKFVEL